MSIVLVTTDRLEQVAFENPGSHVELGPRTATLRVADLFYVAPLDAA